MKGLFPLLSTRTIFIFIRSSQYFQPMPRPSPPPHPQAVFLFLFPKKIEISSWMLPQVRLPDFQLLLPLRPFSFYFHHLSITLTMCFWVLSLFYCQASQNSCLCLLFLFLHCPSSFTLLIRITNPDESCQSNTFNIPNPIRPVHKWFMRWSLVNSMPFNSLVIFSPKYRRQCNRL